MGNMSASTSTDNMAKIKKIRKANPRKTVHNDNRKYKIEQRPPDIRMREYETKPYK